MSRGPRIDRVGRQFGRLVIVGLADGKRVSGKLKRVWQCQCQCGSVKDILWDSLRSGRTQSCGCLTLEVRRASASTPLPEGLVYRQFAREHESWRHAKLRCTDPSNEWYEWYGQRGITMCESWSLSFRQFYEDMGPRPEGYTLERKDVNGHYSPDNCEWIPKSKQCHNKQNTVRVELNGSLVCAIVAARAVGLYPQTLYSRIARGITGSALLAPPKAVR